jgi:hypothetical protein
LQAFSATPIISSKSITVGEKKNWRAIFDIINTSCNFQQNRWKEVAMDINGLIRPLVSLAAYILPAGMATLQRKKEAEA